MSVQQTVPCGDCGEPGEWRAGYGCKGRIDLREGMA